MVLWPGREFILTSYGKSKVQLRRRLYKHVIVLLRNNKDMRCPSFFKIHRHISKQGHKSLALFQTKTLFHILKTHLARTNSVQMLDFHQILSTKGLNSFNLNKTVNSFKQFIDNFNYNLLLI